MDKRKQSLSISFYKKVLGLVGRIQGWSRGGFMEKVLGLIEQRNVKFWDRGIGRQNNRQLPGDLWVWAFNNCSGKGALLVDLEEVFWKLSLDLSLIPPKSLIVKVNQV